MSSKKILSKKNDNEDSLLRKRVKELEKHNELLNKQLKDTRASKFKLAIGKQKDSKGSQFCRVIIPDSHGSSIDPKACTAFLHDLELINPSEIVMLGDHLECGGFLAQHHTLGYVAQSKYTFADDAAACNQFLDKIQEVSDCQIHYIEGNHERRIQNWIVTQTLKNPKDAEYVMSMFSLDNVIFLSKRGIRLIQQGEFYDKVKLPSTIKLGHCYFTHGSSTAKHAASVHVQKFGGNIVYGHTHRRDSYTIKTVKAGEIGGWSPGCLCKLQPLWMHTNPTDWAHGYGLQMVRSNGEFLHINVPIIDGKSLLSPLIEELK